jgi:DNA polymerase-1
MVNLLIEHINQSEVIAYDTETTGLNVRKNEIVGWSASGEEGVGFYLPTQKWNTETNQLEECLIGGKSAHDLTKKLLTMLKGKKLVMHNASFDCRITKNYYGVSLLEDLWVDTALLVHTVQEEGAGMGVFGLKALAISIQKEIGLDVQEAANKEQVELRESIKANGGSTTKDLYEIFKADMDILSKYAAADTDLTLRVCNHFLKVLKAEGLEKFFFEDEVMPLYKEVTVPMEELGVALDLPLLEKTKEDIINDLQLNKKIVLKSILSIPEAQEWVVDTALSNYPPSNKGNWAQNLVMMHSLPLERSEKTKKYSLTKKSIDQLDESNIKQMI